MGQRQEHRRVGLGSGVGLNVGVVAVEQLLDPLDGQTFGHVYILASAVVALARVAFSILVCKHRILDRLHRPNDCLNGIGKNRRSAMAAAFQFALAKTQGITQREGIGNLMQGFLANEVGAQARHFAFGQGRKSTVEFQRHHTVQNRIANEFKTFVMR